MRCANSTGRQLVCARCYAKLCVEEMHWLTRHQKNKGIRCSLVDLTRLLSTSLILSAGWKSSVTDTGPVVSEPGGVGLSWRVAGRSVG